MLHRKKKVIYSKLTLIFQLNKNDNYDVNILKIFRQSSNYCKYPILVFIKNIQAKLKKITKKQFSRLER